MILMAIIVTPLGVVAAVYLHEYAGKNSLTKIIRIAESTRGASIVYGVFGLGFFVYTLGAASTAFYPEALPSPTFGSPVSSGLPDPGHPDPAGGDRLHRRGLARSRAPFAGFAGAGCHQAETLWRIVLPYGSPAIMTGLILAIARAAGEVAPLMLVGWWKLLHVTDGRQLPVPARGAQVHAPGLPHL